jgi:uncharacterized protein (TIGR03435 family)
MKNEFSLLNILVIFFCLDFGAYAQPAQQTPKPVDFIVKGTHIFLKAEMSLASPEDLKHRFMQWCSADEEYKNRQFVAKGVSGLSLIMAAYRTSGDRFIDKAGLSKALYSAEIIVPAGCEHMLDPLLKQTVQAGLGIAVKWEKIETKVGILKIRPSSQVAFKVSKEANGVISWDNSGISATGHPMSELASMLGSIIGFPVLDETKLADNYDIKVKWEEGNLQSLKKNLENLGLVLVVENRLMDMLVIRPAVKSGT